MCATAENGHNDIIYRVAEERDRDNVLEFIRKHYYPEEPITIGNSPKHQDEADEVFSLSVITYGASLIAIDPMNDDKLVGVILSGPIGPAEADLMMEESKRCENDNKKWSEILLLLAYLERNANIYERYNVNKALYVHNLGVHTQYRGKSIGFNLMQKTLDLAKSLGYPLVTADCTSVFSIRIAEKLQMECLQTVPYKDYTDENGRQIFNPPLPHTQIKTFAKYLQASLKGQIN